ncbi:choline/carnitine O-acyltransferase [Secundilactobacillus folii]|uniref:Choline/carnitine acyltransferase domain-containing protein n=1 Tax=Secundilactobacillus folii TaxID=2678357 RepID=A0A7X2XWN4_9LACO|nr:choline/carnitine O-acyltransferase [Secundilactobacillus folii]MTV82303.1 hypothetical protein [Secundilactobacillus folii]
MTGKYTTDLLPQLPKLPLPELDETLKRLSEWAAPLLGEAERDKFADQIKQFQQSDAQELQALLLRNWTETNASWLAPIWRHGYLTDRQPIQSTSNFGLTISPDRLPDLNQIDMAAKLLQNFADQYLAYAKEEVPVETSKTGQAVDMSYYQNFFRTQRQPHSGSDRLQRTRATVTNVEATVIYHQTFYQVRLIDHAGRVSTLHSLTEAFKEIMANAVTDSFFVGAYTGLPRDNAAKLRLHLASDSDNHVNLDRISNSLLVVTLADQETPISLKETLLGPNERVFDKTIQVVIDTSGGLGIAFEHSDIDGVPALNLLKTVVANLSQPADAWDAKGKPHYQQLKWRLDNYTREALAEAQHQNTETARSIQFASNPMTIFGKSDLKALGISPDAFFHTALALAEYKTTGAWRSIYEPVSMRAFYQGRTENARSINVGKRDFAEAFAAGSRDAAVKQLFDHAVTEHTDRVHLAQKGFGVERHLLGLKYMMQQNGGEAAFPDAAEFFNSGFLKQLETDFFSTTGVPYDLIDTFSFAPTSNDGYGIYYGILDDRILLTVSAWDTNPFGAEELLTVIRESLKEVYGWLKAM